MERRTPRTVPIVVSAGLAVGVFCGLLFGLGTGASEAATEPRPKLLPVAVAPTAAPTVAATAQPTAAPTPAPTPVAVAPKPAAPAAAEVPRTAKVTVDISPAAAASGARISIDGTQIEGTSIEIPVDKKSVRLLINSAGFRQIDKKIELEGSDIIIRQEMARRNMGAGTGKIRTTSTSNPAPVSKPADSGRIDL